MPVLGIDFGSMSTVVAAVHDGFIDVLCNEVSARLTPSMVSFGEKRRNIGTTAKDMEMQNFGNTVNQIKRLIGLRYDEDREIIDREANFLNFDIEKSSYDDYISVSIKDKNNNIIHYNMVQVCGMYFAKLRSMAEQSLKVKIWDLVVTVPHYFSECQRRILADACKVAGFNVLRIINETTAACIQYSITRADKSDESGKLIGIVDIGHSSITVSIGNVSSKKIEIKGVSFNANFGGRDIDEMIVDFFVEKFGNKLKDIKKNRKLLCRFRQSCEKLKRVLSTNTTGSTSFEYKDEDIDLCLTASELEKLLEPYLSVIDECASDALSKANVSVDDIYVVDLIGGTTRVCAVKQRINALFKEKVSSTLNQDESVACGAAYMCAILSPSYRAREIIIQDVFPYCIKMTWDVDEQTGDQDDGEVVVFPLNCAVPCTKMVTFTKEIPFKISLCYNSPNTPFKSLDESAFKISEFVVGVDHEREGKVKVSVCLGEDQIVSVDGAKLEECIEEIVETPSESPEEKKGEEPSGENDKPLEESEKKKTKKLVKYRDLPVSISTYSHDSSQIKEFIEVESQLQTNDTLVIETENTKNLLEEYVYLIRRDISPDGAYHEFLEEEERSRISDILQKCENWLYEEYDESGQKAGWDCSKEVYLEKHGQLEQLCRPFVSLYREYEEFVVAKCKLENSYNKGISSLNGMDVGDEMKEDKLSTVSNVEDIFQTYSGKINDRMAKPKSSPGMVVSAVDIDNEAGRIDYLVSSFLDRVKQYEAEKKKEEEAAKQEILDKQEEEANKKDEERVEETKT